jgi:hypothetical protein
VRGTGEGRATAALASAMAEIQRATPWSGPIRTEATLEEGEEEMRPISGRALAPAMARIRCQRVASAGGQPVFRHMGRQGEREMAAQARAARGGPV